MQLDKKFIDSIHFYGEDHNYIHLKFGKAHKMYNFTEEFMKNFPYFTEEFLKYWEDGENPDGEQYESLTFKKAKDVVDYVFENNIPVYFYFNFTDTPAYSKEDIYQWLGENA